MELEPTSRRKDHLEAEAGAPGDVCEGVQTGLSALGHCLATWEPDFLRTKVASLKSSWDQSNFVEILVWSCGPLRPHTHTRREEDRKKKRKNHRSSFLSFFSLYSFQSFFQALHLLEWMIPVSSSKMMQLNPVIELALLFHCPNSSCSCFFQQKKKGTSSDKAHGKV